MLQLKVCPVPLKVCLLLESSGHQKDDQERMRSVKQRPVWQMVWLNDWKKMEDVQLFPSVLSILSRWSVRHIAGKAYLKKHQLQHFIQNLMTSFVPAIMFALCLASLDFNDIINYIQLLDDLIWDWREVCWPINRMIHLRCPQQGGRSYTASDHRHGVDVIPWVTRGLYGPPPWQFCRETWW